MMIDVSVQHNAVGLSLVYYTVDPLLLPSNNPFECHEEVLYICSP